MKTITLFTALLLSLSGIVSAQNSLKPKMRVSVTIAGVPASEVTRFGTSSYTVDDSGSLTLPLLESPVKVSGLTGTKAAAKLIKVYKEAGIYGSPIFDVNSVVESESEDAIRRRFAMEAALKEESIRRQITYDFEKRVRDREEKESDTKVVLVTGHAEKKGKYKLTYGMTVQTLLAECGGDSQFGSKKRFILKRDGKSQEYNFSKELKHLQISLRPGDLIEIPEGTGIFGKN